MGNDFEARKRAKKRKSTDVDPELASEGGKKARKKRAAVRRLCKGMCYNEPSLTEEDKLWHGEDAPDGGEESNRERRAAQASVTELNKAEQEALEKKEAAKAKQKQRRAAKQFQTKLSTAISLTEPGEERCKAQTGLAERDFLGDLHMPLHEDIKRYLVRQGFTGLTPVQEGDVVATAEPGSGKTLGYLVPAITHILRLREEPGNEPEGPTVLVLVPTRELALQVTAVCKGFHKDCSMRATAIIGGVGKDQQGASLEKKPDIIVATPGRLLDLTDDGSLHLGDVGLVVLDEADKMLGLGLQPQLKRIRRLLMPRKPPKSSQGALLRLPQRKRPQVLMFSATSTAESEETTLKWLRSPVRIQVNTSATAISPTVTQAVHVCAEHKKPQKLLKHLQQIKDKSNGLRNPPRVLIFTNRIKTACFLYKTVLEADFRVALLHGDKSQREREEAMMEFRSGKVQVLVATDVAARGLHIRGLPYVVNYDFPPTLEQYIHRAGRAGRLASNGHCYSFFTRNFAPLAQPLLELLQAHQQNVDPNLVRLAESFKAAAEKLKGMDSVEEGHDSGELGVAQEEGDVLMQLLGGPEKGDVEQEDNLGPGQPEQGLQTEVSASTGVNASRKNVKRALPGRLRRKLQKAKLQ